MTRSLAALFCVSALLGAPTRSEAGVIPWMYDSIFGYGNYGGYRAGYGGWGAGYGGYTTGYAPFYSGYTASYGLAYGGGGNCCATTANYAPWTGYGYGSGCCSPCGSSCGNACGGSCGTGCDTGCSNCPGGNCGSGNCGTGSSSNTVPSTPADSGAQPTYVPPTNTNDRTPPQDQFGPARSRENPAAGPGSSAPPTGGLGTPGGFGNTPGGFGTSPGGFGTSPSGADVEPNAPGFAPGNPSTTPRSGRGNEDSRIIPRTPFQPGDKVAFKTPAKFGRTNLQPVFELPTIVSAPSRALPEVSTAPTAVASK